MSDITKLKVGNDTYNIKDEESRNSMAETVLSTDNVPFVSKLMSAGKYQRKKFVGCSFVWNQKINNGNFADGTANWYVYNAVYGSISASDNVLTLTANRERPYSDVAVRQSTTVIANHKYLCSGLYKPSVTISISALGGVKTFDANVWTRLISIISASNDGTYIGIGFNGTPAIGDTLDIKEINLIDLTQLFGSTAIADYIYNLEQATAGAGVAKLKELGFFTEDYYAYDAGSVQSVDIKEYSVTGFNLWDEQWELGTFDTTTGGNRAVSNQIRSKNYIPIKGDTNYYFKGGDWVIFFNVDKNVITDDLPSGSRSGNSVLIRSREFKTPKNSAYMRFYCLDSYGTTYNNDICINLSDPARNGQYEPYHKSTYPLTPTELRGVPKIDANNNIYCDGDEYASDGGHTEKYDMVDMGELNWSLVTNVQGGTFFFADDNIVKNLMKPNGNTICPKYLNTHHIHAVLANEDKTMSTNYEYYNRGIYVKDTTYESEETPAAAFKAAMSGVPLVYEKATPTTETLTPFDYPQSVGSLEEITDYKVEQEQRDVTIPTGHVTEYMGKGGEFTLPTLPDTPSVLAFDGHNAYWEENTINLVKAFMNENRRTRRDITNDLANLSQAVAEQNLGKYGYSIGDYFTGASGYTYILADYNTFKTNVNPVPQCIASNHLGIVVNTNTASLWHSGNASEVGYAGSVLHSYLSSTVLDTIKTDFIALFGGTTGLEHLVSHSKILTTTIESWAWQSDQYISALTCSQVDVISPWIANGLQEGEASKTLELFRKYKWTEIFSNETFWLRELSSYVKSDAPLGSFALHLHRDGYIQGKSNVTQTNIFAVGLIIFA